MAEFSLPTDLNTQWASAGDILKPTDTKIQQGWAPEIPPRQWFNWLDNRQDQAIAHIAQHGIPVWSSTLEYQAGKSYVQGSDGIVYKALTTHTNINPVGGTPGNWESAFITATTATQVASAAQSRAMTANNVYLSPLQLANAFTGTNQHLVTSGFQKFPGGFIMQWGLNNAGVVTFPTPFITGCFNIQLTDYNELNHTRFSAGVPSLTSFTIAAETAAAGLIYWFAVGK